MRKSTYDRFTKMAIGVLSQIPQISKIDEIKFKKYTQSEINEFLFQCHELGYVKFIDAYRDANATPHFEHLIPPGLTISGYQFLNSLYASNALKNSRFAKISSISAIAVSLLSVISNIVLVYLSIQ